MEQGSEKKPGEKPVENMVFMENLSSSEHFFREGQEPRRVLSDISILIKRAEAWGINGRDPFEIKLLLEIMANIRPYDEGKCVLVERGMLRHKRIILPHVFYIGSSDMLYNNMNVLEFLMFAMAKFKTHKVELQEQIFEFIIDIGLGSISLTPNKMLTKEEKAVIILIAAAYSQSMMVVFNFPEYEFDAILMGAIARISGFMRERGKTLILGTQNCLLIEKACSHTAFIADGKLIYQGTVERLRLDFDKIVVIVRDKNMALMIDKLAALLPGYKLFIKNDNLLISRPKEGGEDPGRIYRKILELGWIPEYVEINPKTVENAYEELVLQYDLQK